MKKNNFLSRYEKIEFYNYLYLTNNNNNSTNMSYPLSSYISNMKSIIKKIERDSVQTVTFGKYKEKSYYELYCDKKYKKWILSQSAETISMINIQEYCRKLDIIKNIA